MIRALAFGFGLLEVVAPRRIVEPAERLAFENPDDGRLRPWTVPMARLEGLAFCWLLAGGPERVRKLRGPLAVLGFAMALLPQRALEFGLAMAYENPNDLEVKSWVGPATRLIGACYLVVALLSRRAGGSTDG